MKKRMLITTIVMVLVVAIALTTSSLAWFTMSATVSISEVSFGAISYDGAQLSVAGLARSGWGSSASIGSGEPFDPSQGDPTVAKMNFPTDGSWANVSYSTGTFQQAGGVETTAAGNLVKDQKVSGFSNSATAAFIGGFNVRNDGSAGASVTISAELKVGKAWLVNPTGDENTADDFYVYGDFNAEHANVTTYGISYSEANEWYTTTGGTPAQIQAAFTRNQNDLSLAGGLRVAVFTREWTWNLSDGYSNEAPERVAVYAFTNYKVEWTANGWYASTDVGTNNRLYIEEPQAGTYSMNSVLADGPTFYVNAETAGIGLVGQVDADNEFVPLSTNTIPEISLTLAGDDGDRSGVEVVVVVWLDGWDNEAVSYAGGGLVSLAYSVASETIS